MDRIYDFIKENEENIKRGGIILVGVLLAYLILSPIVSFLSKPALVEVHILPKTAVVKINDEEYRNGVYELRAGEYSGEISADGYQTKKVDFSVEAHETTKILNYLSCEDGTLECYKENLEAIEEMRELAIDQGSYEFARDYLEDKKEFESDPISIFMPYESDAQGFKVELKEASYKEGVKSRLIVDLKTCIESRKNGLKENFLAWMKSMGLETDKYDIAYWYCDGRMRG